MVRQCFGVASTLRAISEENLAQMSRLVWKETSRPRHLGTKTSLPLWSCLMLLSTISKKRKPTQSPIESNQLAQPTRPPLARDFGFQSSHPTSPLPDRSPPYPPSLLTWWIWSFSDVALACPPRSPSRAAACGHPCPSHVWWQTSATGGGGSTSRHRQGTHMIPLSPAVLQSWMAKFDGRIVVRLGYGLFWWRSGHRVDWIGDQMPSWFVIHWCDLLFMHQFGGFGGRMFQAEEHAGELLTLKYIDLTYMVHAVAAGNLDWTLLAHSAIHGAVAGYTGFVSGPIN